LPSTEGPSAPYYNEWTNLDASNSNDEELYSIRNPSLAEKQATTQAQWVVHNAPIVYQQPPNYRPIAPTLVTFYTISNDVENYVNRQLQTYSRKFKSFFKNYSFDVKRYAVKTIGQIRQSTADFNNQLFVYYNDARYMSRFNPYLKTAFDGLRSNLESKALVQILQTLPLHENNHLTAEAIAVNHQVFIDNLTKLTSYVDIQLSQLIAIIQKIQSRNIEANFDNLKSMVELYELYAALIKIGIDNIFEKVRLGQHAGDEVTESFEYVRAWAAVSASYVPGVNREYGITL